MEDNSIKDDWDKWVNDIVNNMVHEKKEKELEDEQSTKVNTTSKMPKKRNTMKDRSINHKSTNFNSIQLSIFN